MVRMNRAAVVLLTLMIPSSGAMAATATYTPAVPSDGWPYCGPLSGPRVTVAGDDGVDKVTLAAVAAASYASANLSPGGPVCPPVTVDPTGYVEVTDSGRAISTAQPCRNVVADAVVCGYAQVAVSLGGGDDYFGYDLNGAVQDTGSVGELWGPDTIDGGDGNDQIRSVNGANDIVSCGAGADTVIADAGDQVAADCETVTRVP